MKSNRRTQRTHPVRLLLFWLYVAIPLGWGVWSTLKKALALFN